MSRKIIEIKYDEKDWENVDKTKDEGKEKVIHCNDNSNKNSVSDETKRNFLIHKL